MESQINPNTIQERAEKLAADASAAEKPAVEAPKVDATPTPDPVKTEAKPEVKPEAKVESAVEKPVPNDPAELRKWNTKVSQENAAMREEIKGLKAAVEKMLKKPVDYKELAKNPEAIQKQIELERQEAAAELQAQLDERTNKLVESETRLERIKCEQDTANFPRWKELFPLIQSLAANADGRIVFTRHPSEVLPDLYRLADQLSPVAPQAPAPVQTPTTPVKTEAEIAAEIAAAEKRGFEKAQAALRDEQNGAGIGSAGKGGRRSSGVSKEALQDMPLKDLKKLISQE